MASVEHVVNLGPQGRIVIPAGVRRDLGLEEGSALLLRIDGRRLVLEPRGQVLRRIRERYRARPSSTRLSRELIADRRAEARRESGR
ncbi:MAG TPA: AbrB/MazE/SpoVT family DNA-binding domain-containing protein [Actinomycetota bacterium]